MVEMMNMGMTGLETEVAEEVTRILFERVRRYTLLIIIIFLGSGTSYWLLYCPAVMVFSQYVVFYPYTVVRKYNAAHRIPGLCSTRNSTVIFQAMPFSDVLRSTATASPNSR